MTHNQAAVDLLAARLAAGLIHPGDPERGQQPTPLLLPGLSSTGIPPEMAEHFARVAGLPTNDAPRLLAEAIVHAIEAELAGGSTIVADATLTALQHAAAEAEGDTRVLSVFCHCDPTHASPLLALLTTRSSDTAMVDGKTLLGGLAQRAVNCPHDPVSH